MTGYAFESREGDFGIHSMGHIENLDTGHDSSMRIVDYDMNDTPRRVSGTSTHDDPMQV